MDIRIFIPLSVESNGGINSNFDILTHEGFMTLNSVGNNIILGPNVDLQSAEELHLQSSSYDLLAEGPNVLKSYGNMTIDVPVIVGSNNDLMIHSNQSVSILRNVSSNGFIEFKANEDCVTIDDEIWIHSDSVITGNEVHLIGGDVRLDGLIEINDGSLKFEECCSTDEGLSIGGAYSDSYMTIDATELGNIIATNNPSKYITFESKFADVKIDNVEQDVEMHRATTAQIKIISHKNISFNTGSNSFYLLEVESTNGVHLNDGVDLSTTHDNMKIVYSQEELIISHDVNIFSEGLLSLEGNEIRIDGNVGFESEGNLTIKSSMYMSLDDNVVHFKSNASITIEKNITSNGTLNFWVNENCNQYDLLHIKSGVVVKAKEIIIRGSSFKIEGLVDIGNGKLIFEELCSSKNSMVIGGNSESNYNMDVSYWTLSRILAQHNAENYITFKSKYGKIDVYAVNQNSHMNSARTAQIEIITSSNKNISFIQGDSSFHTLKLDSYGGIVQNYNLESTVGFIDVVYRADDWLLESNKNIQSSDYLSISSSSEKLIVEGSNKFLAQTNLTIDPPIFVTTSNNILISANASIHILNNITSPDIVEFYGNVDCQQTDRIFISNNAFIDANRINIRGQVINIYGELVIGNGSLLFEEHCERERSIGIGNVGLPVAMHIDDSLLSRITAQFSLYNYITFNSNYGSIEVHNVNQNTDMIKANTARMKLISTGSVNFTSGDSSFHTLEVDSNYGIFQEYNVDTTVGHLVYNYTNQNCVLHSGVDLTSAEQLVISGIPSQRISILGESRINSQEIMTISSPIDVSNGNDIYLHSNASIIIENNITTSETLDIIANVDCQNLDSIILYQEATLKAKHMNIKSTKIAIWGTMDIGNGSMVFEEFCEIEHSMVIGGSANISYNMVIDYDTLGRIVATYDSQNYITFRSVLGHIDVYHVDQSRDFNFASTAQIEIISHANKNISFTQDQSAFHTLKITSNGGIIQNHDIKSTIGFIDVTFSGTDWVMESNVNIISADYLSISSSDENFLLGGTNQILAKKNITLNPPIFVTSNNNLLITSNASIHILNNITSNNDVEFYSNVDCVNTDNIFISQNAIINANRINVRGEKIEIFGKLIIGTGSLLFEEHCNFERSIAIGNSSLPVAMHIDDSLLNRIEAQFSSSNYITFYSKLGSIEVHSVEQENDMQSATTARIKLISEKNTNFSSGLHSFHTLEVDSNYGIFQKYNVDTTVGHLYYNFSGSNFVLEQGVDITSAAQFTLSGEVGREVLVEGESTIQSAKEMAITSPITLINGNDIHLISNTTMVLGANITTASTIDLRANGDCSGNHFFILESDATLKASHVDLKSSAIRILGWVDFESMMFEEFCEIGNSIVIGGNLSTHVASYMMVVDYWTLGRLISSFDSNKYITFRSQFGHIDVHNVDQEIHMLYASTSQIEVWTVSQKNISIIEGDSIFHTLKLHSQGGVVQNYDVTTMPGFLDAIYYGDDWIMEQNRDITSANYLKISSPNNELIIGGSNKFLAQTNLTIDPPIFVTTSNNILISANASIHILNNITSPDIVEFYGNVDCQQTDRIFISNNAFIDANRINIRGQVINIYGELVIGNGSLLFEEHCERERSIGIGNVGLPVAMHIDDSLLSRITAQFSLYNYITFNSNYGSIEVHNVNQNTDMIKANTARMKLISAGNTMFTNGESFFHTLEVIK